MVIDVIERKKDFSFCCLQEVNEQMSYRIVWRVSSILVRSLCEFRIKGVAFQQAEKPKNGEMNCYSSVRLTHFHRNVWNPATIRVNFWLDISFHSVRLTMIISSNITIVHWWRQTFPSFNKRDYLRENAFNSQTLDYIISLHALRDKVGKVPVDFGNMRWKKLLISGQMFWYIRTVFHQNLKLKRVVEIGTVRTIFVSNSSCIFFLGGNVDRFQMRVFLDKIIWNIFNGKERICSFR